LKVIGKVRYHHVESECREPEKVRIKLLYDAVPVAKIIKSRVRC